MNLDRIISGPDVSGTVHTGRKTSGHINALLISTADGGAKVTVRLNGKKNRTLIAGVTVADLLAVNGVNQAVHSDGANYLRGMGMEMVAQLEALSADLVANVAGSTYTFDHDNLSSSTKNLIYRPVNYTTPQLRLDLGSLYLSGRDQIEVTINQSIATAGNSDRVACYSVSDAMTPYHIKRYEVKAGSDVQLDNCVALSVVSNGLGWVYSDADDVYENAHDMNFNITAGDDDINIDYLDLLAVSTCLVRDSTKTRILKVWKSEDNIPQSVDVSTTGTNADDAVFMAEYLEFPRGQTSMSTFKKLQRLLGRVENLVEKDPDTAQQMRHAGLIPSVKNIVKMAKGLKSFKL